MPYSEHGQLPPAEGDRTLWRFMTLENFLAAIVDESLYFARLDQMADPLEGSYSTLNQRLRKEWYGEHAEKIAAQWPLVVQKAVELTYINCWYSRPRESNAMWALYGTLGRGVAIRSSLHLLRDALIDERDVYVCDVTYTDFETQPIPEGNLLFPALFKHDSFEHESEVRAITTEWNEPTPLGLPIRIDFDTLIDAVVIAPQAPDHLVRVVERVLPALGISAAVQRSAIPTTRII